MEMLETVVHGVRMEKASGIYYSRAMRWTNVRYASGKTLRKVIDIKKNFNFRPYA